MTVESLGRRLQRLAVRTGTGPLRPLWALAHIAVIRFVARRLTSGLPGARAYLKGGFGFGRPVYGLSDVDMIVVTPDPPPAGGSEDPSAIVRERWRELSTRFPTLADLFNDGEVWTYHASDTASLGQDSYLTFGFLDGDGAQDRAAFLGHGAPHDPMALLDHPGLYGPQRDWRALGARRRPPEPVGAADDRAIYAWLELRFIWGYAFLTCIDPGTMSAAYTCQKLVSDSARVWLWLVQGEQLFDRAQVLRRALQLLPEEEEALTGALDLSRRLRRRPDPPLAETLPFLVRTSARIAEHLARRARDAGATSVNLRWEGGEGALPLVDWRARAIPCRLDTEFAIWPGDPGEPDRIAAVAQASEGSTFPALRTDSLLVFPTSEIWHRGRLRGVECETSDPVSFALASGAAEAAFPNLPGWSAQDSARRAVAEHRGWLALGRPPEGDPLPYWVNPVSNPSLAELAGLFSAARAALLVASLRQGEPEIGLTPAAIGSQLAEHVPDARTLVEAACGEILQAKARDSQPDPATVAALRQLVCELPAYQVRSSGSTA